jgi:replicative DNA helicase
MVQPRRRQQLEKHINQGTQGSMKKPPYSEQAECAVIAAVLNEPSLAFDTDLRTDHFYDRRNALVWRAILEMAADGNKIDHIVVAQWLESDGKLDMAGGVDRFLEFNDFRHTRAAFADYCAIIKDAHHCREQIRIMDVGIEAAYAGDDATADVIGKLASLSIGTEEPVPMEKHCADFVEECKAGNYGRFRWWDEEWTRKLGRLTSELIILHAPRSTGKTALMLQWMIAAHRMGQRTPLASIEMLRKELAPRLVATLGQVGTYAMRARGHVTTEEERRAQKAIDELRKLNLCIRDKAMTIDDICAWALREKRNGVDAVFIDNLLSISAGGKQYQSKTIMYDEFIRRLRDLRDQLQCPVILLAHPNAENSIAWSKDVENFADIIMFLQEVPPEGIKTRPKGRLITPMNNALGKHIIAVFQKNRNGICPFYASLDFVGSVQTFAHVQFEE